MQPLLLQQWFSNSRSRTFPWKTLNPCLNEREMNVFLINNNLSRVWILVTTRAQKDHDGPQHMLRTAGLENLLVCVILVQSWFDLDQGTNHHHREKNETSWGSAAPERPPPFVPAGVVRTALSRGEWRREGGLGREGGILARHMN